jgi:nucleotide-binding universal stress UspA family protein
MSRAMLRRDPHSASTSGTRTAIQPLFTRPVLLATDGTNAAHAAVRFTAALARHRQAQPQVLSVLAPRTCREAAPDGRTVALSTRFTEAERRDQRLREIRNQVRVFAGDGAAGDAAWPIDVEFGAPVATITREASSRGAGSIVLGLRPHTTLDRLFRDETSLLVIRNATVPVLAITPTLSDLPRRVIAAVDFSRASLRAVRAASSVLGEGATLLLVHVQPEIDFGPEEAEGFGVIYTQGVVGAFARLQRELNIPSSVTVETVFLRGTATAELLAFAERAGAELIALGSQRHELGGLALGSVTRALVRDGRSSLLVTPPGRHGSARLADDARLR